jgi:hypothetical protein
MTLAIGGVLALKTTEAEAKLSYIVVPLDLKAVTHTLTNHTGGGGENQYVPIMALAT